MILPRLPGFIQGLLFGKRISLNIQLQNLFYNLLKIAGSSLNLMKLLSKTPISQEFFSSRKISHSKLVCMRLQFNRYATENPCSLEKKSNFLSKLKCYAIFLGTKFHCTRKIKLDIFASCFHSIIAHTRIAIFTFTSALMLRGK